MGLQGGYKLDIVFVIDATGSMDPIMKEVKARALTMGEEIKTEMAKASRPISEMRLRVIDFGDYATEADEAIRQTDFFSMPADKQKFEDAVQGIDYEGRGGDAPENALEALYVAMMSDWTKIGLLEKGRHIIVLMTDAYPLHLQERKECVGYPADDFPPDLETLQKIWIEKDYDENNRPNPDKTTQLSASGKRLLIFAPDGKDALNHSWQPLTGWEQSTFTAVDPTRGLLDMPLDGIIAEIVRSV